MTQKNILAGNWKMNLGISESRELALDLSSLSGTLSKTEIWVAPSFVCIPAVVQATHGSPLRCGSQNVHWEAKGAYTGELSIAMLKECGCSFAIVGHSERRHIFGESSSLVAQRALAALSAELTTVLCIGEKLEERESGNTDNVLEEQLSPVLEKLTEQQASSLVIAYEPVWAIGTGKVASLTEIEEAHASIENYWKSRIQFAPCPPILYGGSVKPDNFEGIINIDLVAGALIGGASLNYDKMKAMADISES
jgi:triosephosphate isomerase (TIM)